MTDDEIIAVVQAHKEGKLIQARNRGSSTSSEEGWGIANNDPTWNFRDHDYRVAPEPRKPREWWMQPQKLDAESTPGIYGAIHVREVIE